jgi:hypothetical protein
MIPLEAWPRDTIARGIFGGPGGVTFIDDYRGTTPIETVFVWSAQAIDGIRLRWRGNPDLGPRRGGLGGEPYTFVLSEGAVLKAVEGTVGAFEGKCVVTSLVLRASDGELSPTFGLSQGERFSVVAPDGYQVAGFWGAEGRIIDALGVLMTPIG